VVHFREDIRAWDPCYIFQSSLRSPTKLSKAKNLLTKSQSWIFTLHTSRFQKPGDYFKLESAGTPFILIMGKDGTVQAFHNVCQHRAYPVITKDSGSSTVLGTPPFFLIFNSSVWLSVDEHQAVATTVGLTMPRACSLKLQDSRIFPALIKGKMGCLISRRILRDTVLYSSTLTLV